MYSILDPVVYLIPSTTGFDWATTLSAAAAMFSSVTAIIALIYTHKQVKMHELHNKLMSKPFLTSGHRAHIETDEYEYSIDNSGLGPAIITSISVKVNSRELKGSFYEMLNEATDELVINRAHLRSTTFGPGDMIPAGQSHKIILLKDLNKSNITPMDTYKTFKDNLTITIEYTSIYGEKQTFDSDLSNS